MTGSDIHHLSAMIETQIRRIVREEMLALQQQDCGSNQRLEKTPKSAPAPEFNELMVRARQGSVPVREILHETGLSQTTWWRWSAGRTEPSLKSLRAIDTVLRKRGA